MSGAAARTGDLKKEKERNIIKEASNRDKKKILSEFSKQSTGIIYK